jgi:RHS repeat-associated protein
VTASYLAGSGFGQVVASVDAGGAAEDALRDRLGTTVGWLGTGGGLTALQVRDAYGVRALPGGVVPFGYTGHAEDPTGLVWGRARCYAPPVGGWHSADPSLAEPRYRYARGAPSFAVDPTGGASAFAYAVVGCFGSAAAIAVGGYYGRLAFEGMWQNTWEPPTVEVLFGACLAGGGAGLWGKTFAPAVIITVARVVAGAGAGAGWF